MICHYVLSLSLVSVHLLPHSDCANTTNGTKLPHLKAESGTTPDNFDSDVKVSKLEPDSYIIPLIPSIICDNETDRLKTLDEVKENCARHHGKIEKGSFDFDIPYLEPVVTYSDEEEFDIFDSQTESTDSANIPKKNITIEFKTFPSSRPKRVKREEVHPAKVPNQKRNFECIGCVSEYNGIIFTNMVKIRNETENCNNGTTNCDGIETPNAALDIVLAAVVSFLFCVLLLGILSCHPIILDGHYIPLPHFPFTGRSEQLMKVRYRNQTLDENDFSVFDFE